MNNDFNTPSLIVNDIFNWQGNGSKHGGFWESCCRLRIYNSYCVPHIVLVEELAENEGTSITNSAENLATLIKKEYANFLSHPGFLYLEYYPPSETFSLVQFNWDGQRFSKPRWSPFSRDAVVALINLPTRQVTEGLRLKNVNLED